MKAVVIEQHGGPEVIEYTDMQTPGPGPGEVQIRLHAAALNHLDLWVRDGWPGLNLQFPHILGTDGTGKVLAVGDGVTGFKPNDRVVLYANISCGRCLHCLAGKQNMCSKWHLLGETMNGTYAEYIVVPDTNLLLLPENVSYRLASASVLVYLTAWHSLVSRGKLQAGESVLIVGASGGVNTASIQIAKYIGAHVLVIGSSPQKLSLAESLGADVLIDRTKNENWSKTVFHETGRQGVDIVVDNVGAKTMSQSMRAAAKGGRILTVGNTSGPKFEIDNRYIFGKHLSILGSTVGTPTDFKKVMTLVFEGTLKPVLDKEYPMSDIATAMERLESGRQMGKISLVI